MRRVDQTRPCLVLCSLLCLALSTLAIAQTETETSTPPTKPAHASATPARKSTHPTTGHATSKRTSTHTSAQKSKNSRGKRGSGQVAKKHGQQVIDAARARQIQTALIREHYLQGEPSGTWDSTTQAAMQRYQADQGWQSKQIPDSRALIKLGLGPSHDHLLNPESAMTTPTPTPAAPAAVDPKAAARPPATEGNLPQQ